MKEEIKSIDHKNDGSKNVARFMVKFGILPILLLEILIFAIIAPEFFTSGNIINIFRTGSINMVIAIGMTMALLTGGIDLSVGSIVALTGVIGLQISLTKVSFLSIPAMLLVGALCGLLNGFFIAYCKLPPFIATLGAMTYLRGFSFIFSNGNSIINNKLGFAWIGNGYLGPIPWIVIIALMSIFIMNYIMTHTIYGRRVYAVGGNQEAAKFTGIKVKSILLSVYVISGLTAAMGGVMVSSRLFSANGLMGTQYELDAIASAIIGGTSFTGGKGSISNALLGALVIGMLTNGLTLMGIGYYWQQVARGLVIIAAVTLDIYRNKWIAKFRI